MYCSQEDHYYIGSIILSNLVTFEINWYINLQR